VKKFLPSIEAGKKAIQSFGIQIIYICNRPCHLRRLYHNGGLTTLETEAVKNPECRLASRAVYGWLAFVKRMSQWDLLH
jgi:hypothetical protein